MITAPSNQRKLYFCTLYIYEFVLLYKDSVHNALGSLCCLQQQLMHGIKLVICIKTVCQTLNFPCQNVVLFSESQLQFLFLYFSSKCFRRIYIYNFIKTYIVCYVKRSIFLIKIIRRGTHHCEQVAIFSLHKDKPHAQV